MHCYNHRLPAAIKSQWCHSRLLCVHKQQISMFSYNAHIFICISQISMENFLYCTCVTYVYNLNCGFLYHIMFIVRYCAYFAIIYCVVMHTILMQCAVWVCPVIIFAPVLAQCAVYIAKSCIVFSLLPARCAMQGLQ